MVAKVVSLDDLCGEHMLDAVDTYVERAKGDNFEDASCIRFRLDGTAYTAVEDPSDGYRSSLRSLSVSRAKMTNTFAPVRVVGSKKGNDRYGSENDILMLIDVKTGKVVLEVGTSNSDDYYPSFVGAFFPENMTINQGAASQAE